ncbi:MAG: YebC/PmpR family DNA-binding transcriptional regulator [Planctomycetota bacterium]|jgi:YebC/PmpR family DNA-binding regulatory protein
MSGHSHWATIKHKKAAADAKKGKLFSKIAKQIYVAARQGGGDPDMNPALRMVLDKARVAGLGKDNVKRAIARATSQGGDGVKIEEINYEGYGPGGAALLISVATDNRNRTGPAVRNILEKRGGKMGNSGSTAWMFKFKGMIDVARGAIEEEHLMELVLEAGAEDLETGEEYYSITTGPEEFAKVCKALEGAGVKTESAEMTYEAENKIELSVEDARKVVSLMGELEEEDDVNNVYANFQMTAELASELAKDG